MILFSNNGHLNEEAIALYAEGLIDPKVYETIPTDVLDHTDACFDCKQKIMNVFDIIRNDEETKVQIGLKNSLQEAGSLKAKNVFRISTVWMYAAAAVVLLIGIYSVFRAIQPASNDQLFDEYFTPYQNLLTMKGENDSLVEYALYYYDLKIWDSAIFFFKEIKEPYKDIEAIRFYQANALLAMGYPSEAEKHLLMVIATNDDRFKTQANWYLALAMIKSGKNDKAIEILRNLKYDKGIYRSKAMDLINEFE